MKKLFGEHIYLFLVLLSIHYVGLFCFYHRSFINQGMLDYQAAVFLFNVDYLALSHFFCLSAETLPLEILHLDQAFVDFMVLLAWSYLNCP